jgi:hypothetical protein
MEHVSESDAGDLAIGPSAIRTSRDGAPPSLEELAIRNYMLYVLVPLWFVPGVLDWYWHRKTKIEDTSGTFESLTHALMMTSLGIPMMAGLLFDINSLVLTLMAGGFVTHEAIAYWDVNYAKKLREVPTVEQRSPSNGSRRWRSSGAATNPRVGASSQKNRHSTRGISWASARPPPHSWRFPTRKSSCGATARTTPCGLTMPCSA